ncbi:DUF7437 domain-containing protein [Natronobiforma cellulositropha]|uniref:DUF7437 domain-containing protein n=1 Tax=Natronobiforma cellulositropha TaxID=1679076 RepID=UPI0021D5AC63|nr:transcriptional regulator TrmB [Natronobiforma cellulositropha]
MSTDDGGTPTADPEGPFNDLLTYAELVNSPRLARLYTHVLREGPLDVETVKDDLEMAHSTAYKDVGRLEELGVLTRDDEEMPATVSVAPIRLEIDTDHGAVTATPALIDAIGRQLENEDIRVFVERQGVAKLASALHYTLRLERGELTQRTAAKKLGVHPVEGMTVFTALADVLDGASAYDPYVERA